MQWIIYRRLTLKSKDNYEQASKRLIEKEREMIELSKTRVEFNSLIRDLEVEQMTYQKLTALMAEEKIQVNIKNANARIIDKAYPLEKTDHLHQTFFLI